MTPDFTFTSDKLKGFTTECDCTRRGTMCPSTGKLVHFAEFTDPAKLTGWFMEFHCTKSGLWFAGIPEATDAVREVLRDNGILPK